MTKKGKGKSKPRNEAQKRRDKQLPDWVNESNYEEYLDMLVKSKQATAKEREGAIRYKKQLEQYKREQEAYDKARAQETYTKKTRLAQLAEKDRFARNYQARDFTSNITSWTASQVVRKPFNRSGLRNEFQSRGYTDRTSGLPAADYKNMTINLVKGQVKGTLDIGGSGKKVSQNGITPSIVPNLDFILGNPANSGIGKGQVIMPVGVLKIKKRGGKFNVYP